MRRRRRSPEDPKAAALRAAGALHPHPEAVQDDAFTRHEFFDRRDRVQVKYEMLRRHRVDGRPVTEVAAAFGVSRQAFYTAEGAFSGQGIPGLLPRPRGPKRAHKCTDEILEFVARWRAGQEPDAGATVGEAVQRRFGVTIHPRSLARALARREKKRRRRRVAAVSALPRDPRTVLDQYEALRREALEAAPFGPRGHGLALFLSRGLPDWLAALTALVPPGAPSRPIAEPPRDGGPRLEPAARGELTTVLAGMVLACTQPTEVTACTAQAR